MADVLNVSATTWCGKQAEEILIKPTFLVPELEELMDVRIGIKSKEQLLFDEILENILQLDTGCGRTPTGSVVNVSEKFIDLCFVKANLDQCVKNLRSKFTEMWRRGSGLDSNELEGKLLAYVQEKVQDAVRIDINKVAWFGNTLLSATDPNRPLYVCDGFWTRFIASVNAYGITRAHTFGDTLDDCEAITAFRAMWTQRSAIFKSLMKRNKAEFKLPVTSSVWENYQTCLEEKCCGDRGVIRMENGDERLFFRGVEVIEMPEWDRTIEDFSLSFPHRAALYHRPQLILGTDSLSEMNQLKIIYNPFNENNQIDAQFVMGTQFGYPELIIVAY